MCNPLQGQAHRFTGSRQYIVQHMSAPMVGRGRLAHPDKVEHEKSRGFKGRDVRVVSQDLLRCGLSQF
jgi:hypothetical protein